MLDERIFKSEERAVYTLRSLYTDYGYRPYKMSKFEEYELYLRNKDFLVSDRVITFTDTDGRLLALKPDVTLSIIKNTARHPAMKQKVYYNENVYRVSGTTGQFKEIMQTGLECIGDIDEGDIYEVVSLAAKSLSLVGDGYVLDLSHMGLISAFLDEAECNGSMRAELIKLIGEKNAHELTARLCEAGVPEEVRSKLVTLVGIYGKRAEVLDRLSAYCTTDAEREVYEELALLDRMLSAAGFGNEVRFDFSVVNNMSYYNGIVFKGFLRGICDGVLSGGVYGRLLSEMRAGSRGVGFALYLDRLSELDSDSEEYDVDTVLLYGDGADPCYVARVKEELILKGERVYSTRTLPEGLRYRNIVEV